MMAAKRAMSWLTALVAVATGAVGGVAHSAPAPRPNILIVVADDLGYSDIGVFGGEIATPNLDALARRGVQLTGFHTAPTCSPTRAMLLTGADNHEVGLGAMAEMMAMTPAGDRPYEGYLNRRAATIAERLRDGGYQTLMAGKWHMGLTEEQSPKARGFDKSYALLNGGHDHWGDDQSPARFEAGVGASYREDGATVKYPVGEYSSKVFTDKILSYLEANKATDKPFFAYLAYTQPHWPLQAPAADVAKYKGRYDAGYEVLRDERLSQLKRLGLVAADVQAAPITGVKPWASLSDEERARSSRNMEIYAAMVDRMDQSIGRVVSQLKAEGRLDNTLIIFMSDNGPDPSVLQSMIGMKGMTKPEQFGLDNSLANLGARNSFTSYGPGWALASSAPASGAKGAMTQGGIRTTAIVAGPGVAGGRVESDLLHVMDILPTTLSVAGISPDATPSSLPIRGTTWSSVLSGTGPVRRDSDHLGWEFGGSRALREGDWKLVWLAPLGAPIGLLTANAKPSTWALFNLKDDPGETRDLAAQEPERLQRMTAAWNAYAAQSGVVIAPSAH